MGNPSSAASDSNCLGRTCLQWAEDGELSVQDLQLVLQRLAQADQEALLMEQSTAIH